MAESLDRLLSELRPKLHRYCARMTGSVIDGEDVVQDALLKAIQAAPELASIAEPERWLFRIAHNAALDFLRRRAHENAAFADENLDMVPDPAEATDRELAATSLHTFMRLPAPQRSSVILMDVMGYSLQEIGGITSASVPAVKAALHRGRLRLRALSAEPDDRPLPALTESERSLLVFYVDRFNARDFDAIRDMLADEVRLDLVARTRMRGRREVGTYLHNYSQSQDWHFAPGFVDRRPTVLVYDPARSSARPIYFVLVAWDGDQVATIRDFRYARYITDGAAVVTA